jgi:hypothetical protein
MMTISRVFIATRTTTTNAILGAISGAVVRTPPRQLSAIHTEAEKEGGKEGELEISIATVWGTT